MATWKIEADASEESSGSGKGNKFPAAPRGIYTIQVADYKDGISLNTKRPTVSLTCEIADGPEMGKRAGFVNITAIPKGEKGHGIMVHALHAFGLAHDGLLELDTSDFQGLTCRALVGVEQYEKESNGRTFTNERNFIEQLYSEKTPEPSELPEPKNKKAAIPAKTSTSVHQEEEVPF